MMLMSSDLMHGGFWGGGLNTDYHVDKSPWAYLITL